MAVFRKEPSAVVLPVNVHQKLPQIPKLGGSDGGPVHAAGALPLRRDPAGDQDILPRGEVDLVIPQPRYRRFRRRQLRRDARRLSAGTHQLPGHTIPQDGADGVDDDGFAGARLAGEHVKTRAERNIGPLDHGCVFNVE